MSLSRFGTLFLSLASVACLLLEPAPGQEPLLHYRIGSDDDIALVELLLDPDSDGVASLLEYAFGSLPRSPDVTALLPSATTVADAGQVYLAITFRRRVGPSLGITSSVLESTHLETAAALDVSSQIVGSPSTSGTGSSR